MNGPLKLLFDECISRPHIQRLAQFIAISGDAAPEIKHILDFQEQGVWDETWVPRMKSEGYVVITQDRGRKKGGKGDPLPRVCLSHSVTLVILSRRIAERKSFEKLMTVLSVWSDILQITAAPAGSRFVIEPMPQDADNLLRGKMIDRTPPSQPKRKTRLFDDDELEKSRSLAIGETPIDPPSPAT